MSSVGVRDNDVLAGAVLRARPLARTLGAAEAVGVMAACTDAAVAYAKERVQFGRTIGTFQAVKHHCADLLVAAELATAAVWDAARASKDSADEFDLVAAMAAQLAFGPAVHSAQMNIQVHGGIGFTWEHDAHLYLRRALVLDGLLGSPDDAEDVTAHAARGSRVRSRWTCPLRPRRSGPRCGPRRSGSARWRAPNSARRWWRRA